MLNEDDDSVTKTRAPIKVEESLFRSNITHEIEDINKKPAPAAGNPTPPTSQQSASAFSIVRHLFPSVSSSEQVTASAQE